MNNEKGFALLMVLWIMMILMVIVFSFSLMTRTETHATLYFKEGAEKRFIAEAGVQRAVMELFHRGVYKNKQPVTEGHEPVRVDGTKYTGRLGDDRYVFDIVDESGKISLNALTDSSGVIMSNLLVNLGVKKEDADAIVESILDWKDGDELRRLHGAESDHYMSLSNPYRSKNGAFDTVEELLMVKGMTPGILYGSGGQRGIFDLITVRARGAVGGGINVNSAPREVLAALPGMTNETADRIIELRGLAEIRSQEDVKSAIGGGFAMMSPYIGISEANIYTVTATGYKKDEKQGFTVKATIMVEGSGKYRYTYYKSPAGPGR
jgi:general secretion pathway protein K